MLTKPTVGWRHFETLSLSLSLSSACSELTATKRNCKFGAIECMGVLKEDEIAHTTCSLYQLYAL